MDKIRRAFSNRLVEKRGRLNGKSGHGQSLSD